MKFKRLIFSYIILTFTLTSVPAYAGMDFSGLGSSPVNFAEYILNDEVFTSKLGRPIEDLVTPEQVARASLKERKDFHKKILRRFNKLKLRGSPKVAEVEALLNATGLRKERLYMIINGVELRPNGWDPIESLVTPEEMAKASLDERVFAHETLQGLYRLLKYQKSKRAAAVKALDDATGLRKSRGPVPYLTNIASQTVIRSQLRKLVKEGTGDIELHLKKIREINKRLKDMDVHTRILEGESSSPVLNGEVGSVVYSGAVIVK